MAKGLGSLLPNEANEIVKKAVIQGKPVVAQVSGFEILAKAGIMKGKRYANHNLYNIPCLGLLPEGTAPPSPVVYWR